MSESDIQEIVADLVTRAKKGDRFAITTVLGLFLGRSVVATVPLPSPPASDGQPKVIEAKTSAATPRTAFDKAMQDKPLTPEEEKLAQQEIANRAAQVRATKPAKFSVVS